MHYRVMIFKKLAFLLFLNRFTITYDTDSKTTTKDKVQVLKRERSKRSAIRLRYLCNLQSTTALKQVRVVNFTTTAATLTEQTCMWLNLKEKNANETANE